VFKPPEIATEFAAQLVSVQWNKNAPQPFLFQREKESLDYGGRSDARSVKKPELTLSETVAWTIR
jgi:hypothetical protein